MSKTEHFLLRLDPTILDGVKQLAAEQRRSCNQQIEWIIRQALIEAHRLEPVAKKTPSEEPPAAPDSAG